MRLHLSNEDLTGTFTDNLGCPIAKALERRLPGQRIYVMNQRVSVNGIWYKLLNGSSANIDRMQNGGVRYPRPNVVGLLSRSDYAK